MRFHPSFAQWIPDEAGVAGQRKLEDGWVKDGEVLAFSPVIFEGFRSDTVPPYEEGNAGKVVLLTWRRAFGYHKMSFGSSYVQRDTWTDIAGRHPTYCSARFCSCTATTRTSYFVLRYTVLGSTKLPVA